MSLTCAQITSAGSDEELFNLLSRELKARMSGIGGSHENELHALQQLPEGLRAMAAIHALDVSITLDDLVWHFFNYHHHGLAQETLRGLRVLGADEAAGIFEEVYELVRPHWAAIDKQRESPAEQWHDLIGSTGLEKCVEPLNERMWALCSRLGHYGLMTYWLSFARKYPERVTASSSNDQTA